MEKLKILEHLVEIAREAGAAIMEVYMRPGGIESDVKGDESPVTEADRIADGLISARLRALHPDVQIVTEEQVSSQGSAERMFFIVDPLDGTKEFIKRRGDFTVNIALIENGAPVLGVVYAPARKRMFVGAVGEGAFEEVGGKLLPIQVATPNNEALRVVASSSHRDSETDAFIARFSVADVRSAGSSLKFCLVAAGEADVYPRMGRTMEWDTAAGHAVVLAAGGHVVSAATMMPLQYGKAGWDNPKFLVFSPGVDGLDVVEVD